MPLRFSIVFDPVRKALWEDCRVVAREPLSIEGMCEFAILYSISSTVDIIEHLSGYIG